MGTPGKKGYVRGVPTMGNAGGTRGMEGEPWDPIDWGGDPRVLVMEEKGRGTPGIKGDHICASLSLMGSMQGTPKGEGREGLGGGAKGAGTWPCLE